MNDSRRAQAAWLDRTACPEGPPRLHVNSDHLLAPVSFGWWAMTSGERISKYFHVETLYRLDRQFDGQRVRLVRNGYYDMSVDQVRAYLVQRQHALLPKLPANYCWIGPTLIEDVASEPGAVHEHCAARALPERLSARLQLATEIAAGLLRTQANRGAAARAT